MRERAGWPFRTQERDTHGLGSALLNRIRAAGVHLGLGVAGRYRVDVDAVRLKFNRHREGQPIKSGL